MQASMGCHIKCQAFLLRLRVRIRRVASAARLIIIEDACGGAPPHPHALCHALWGMIGQKIHRELHLMIDFVEKSSLI